MNVDPDTEGEPPMIMSYPYGKTFVQKDENLSEEFFFKSVEVNQIHQASLNLLNEISKINHLNCTTILQPQISGDTLLVSSPKYFGGSLRDAINNANHSIGFSEFVYIHIIYNIIRQFSHGC